nr:MAG TPA: hypothetical protein [Caudoviricetes sp.]DAY41086.1 MAG TPA: hypothetical protein [Caudoviricetes sp.]
MIFTKEIQNPTSENQIPHWSETQYSMPSEAKASNLMFRCERSEASKHHESRYFKRPRNPFLTTSATRPKTGRRHTYRITGTKKSKTIPCKAGNV